MYEMSHLYSEIAMIDGTGNVSMAGDTLLHLSSGIVVTKYMA